MNYLLYRLEESGGFVAMRAFYRAVSVVVAVYGSVDVLRIKSGYSGSLRIISPPRKVRITVEEM